MTTQKEIAKKIRSFVKENGIKARVRMFDDEIQLFTKTYEGRFSSDEIFKFTSYAKKLGLFGVYHTEIDPSHEAVLTGKQQWGFYLK